MRAEELGRLTAAWKLGGADGVVSDSWTPEGESLGEARSACVRMGPVQVRADRVTFADGGAQLRLGRAGYWYRFECARDGG